MDGKTGRAAIGLTGLALVGGFFLPWIDLGFAGMSGFQLAKGFQAYGSLSLIMVLVPVFGAAMLWTAITGSRYVRLVSAVGGLVLVGYGVVKTVQTFFSTTSIGLWLVIAAAFAALIVPFLARPEGER